MSTSCNEIRDHLTDVGDDGLGEPVVAHLAGCPGCAEYAARIRTARRLLLDHHSGIQPDESFAARVVDRLRPAHDDALGWAAARLLPATLALLMVLAWLSYEIAPDPRSLLVPSPTDDLVSWAIDLTEEGS